MQYPSDIGLAPGETFRDYFSSARDRRTSDICRIVRNAYRPQKTLDVLLAPTAHKAGVV